ncbi:MAG TPA: hypothetical protein VK826_12860 [Bacteroidia bacterium]|nr:hypothetical protein [Bacteroidia bacterium]
MENLSALISSLTPGEEKLIRHFYKLRDFGEFRKRVQLFDYIAQGRAKHEKELAAHVGYKTPNTSYHNLKSRLKSDIICILLMQESSAKFNTPYAQAIFSCRRALLTGEILLSRGVYGEGLSLLKKASRIAEKFELYAERILVEDTLRNHHAVAHDTREMNGGTGTIENNYRLLGNMMRSKKALYETVFSSLASDVHEPQAEYRPEKMLKELHTLEEESDSSRVSFYSRLSRLKILNNSGNVESALECAHELLQAAEQDPVVMSKSNQAGIHLEMATLYLRRNDYAKAITHAENALILFKPGMLNHVQASTILFYAQVNSLMYKEAEKTLENLLASKSLKDRAHGNLLNKLYLVKSWFHFSKGEKDQAGAGLKTCIELSKEKSNWATGYTLLECMLLVEKRSFDAAMYKLEALRKVVNRGSSQDPGSQRSTVIISVLKKLIRHNGDHQSLIHANYKELAHLRTGEGKCAWDSMGFELIRVEDWIENRVIRKAV